VARALTERERRTETVAAGLLVLVAGVMPALISWRFADPLTAGLLVVCYALLRRVRFRFGPGLIRPTQLVFIPLVFLSPAAWVPGLVALGSVLGELPDLVRRKARPERLLVVIADAWYSIGPALVIAASGVTGGQRAAWGVLTLAVAAQFATDLTASSAREWFGAGIRPRELAPVLALVYVVDAALSPIGYLGVLAGATHRFAYLAAVAPGAVLVLLAEERNARMAHELELERAFRRGTRTLVERTERVRGHSGSLGRLGRRFGDTVPAPEDRAELARLLLRTMVEAVQGDAGLLIARAGDSVEVLASLGRIEDLDAALAAAEGRAPSRAASAVAHTLDTDRVVAIARAGRPFSAVERDLVEHVAAQAGLAMENQRLGELMHRSEVELRAILDGLAEAVVVEDPDGRVVYGNPVAVALLGDAPDLAACLGLPANLLPQRMALLGEDPRPIAVRHGEGRWVRLKASPLPGGAGGAGLVVCVVEDITEIKQAEEAQRFLAESSRLLAGSLAVDETLPRVERLAAALMGGNWVIELADTPATPASPGALTVPVRVRGGTAGTITITGRPFGPLETAVAEDLGLRVGAAVDIARLSGSRAVVTQALHASLLPSAAPRIPGVETAGLYRPAGAGHDIGGDFYDVFSTEADVWFVLIGDVRARGAEAVAVSTHVRYAIRAAAGRRHAPSAILGRVNAEMLAEQTSAYAAIALVRLDLLAGEVTATVACGGHPTPRILRADGVVEAFGSRGTVLGVTASITLENHTVRLRHGDALILYTDGLTHAAEPSSWTPEQLHTVIAGAVGRTAEGIVEDIASTIEGPLRDDLALFAMRVRPSA
jgi:PAS domain-containing protein